MSTSSFPKTQPTRTVVKLGVAPDHLEPIERDLFTRIVREFMIDDSASLSLLTAACEAHQRGRKAREQLELEGQTTRDRFNQIHPHPCVAVERDSRNSYVRALTALRLEPPKSPAKPSLW